MVPFSSSDIVALWEAGREQHPVDRALTVLSLAAPEVGRDALAQLSIGERDALLFQLRERTFGHRLDAYANCPRCGDGVEFTLSSEELRQAPAPDPTPDLVYREDGFVVSFRLPDSADLAEAMGSCGTGPAREALARRCVTALRKDDRVLLSEDLPREAVTGLAERITACDPVADIMLDLVCPACSASWQQPFDIASFFWVEITNLAKQLLREVDALARVYGWSETEILSLGRARRDFYLEMVGL